MTLVPIGTFARMTHVSVKRLRHYHDTDVLVAARVDPRTGYRYYDVRQAEDARLVATLRSLDMPLPRIAQLVRADEADRTTLLASHLDDLQDTLAATGEAVAMVRAMLEPGAEIDVERRQLPPLLALARSARVERGDIDAWCEESFGALYGRLGARLPAGPGAATFADDFFADDVGEVVAFVPVSGGDDAATIAGGAYAVAIHEGPFSQVSRTYAALGRHVSVAGVGLAGPIRETYYLVGPPTVRDPSRYRTEIAWPISHPVTT
ncbi:MerR family transcriptional regulator [Agilicoccus flavus]|uniref:MerR family transcriptional regulator n=1 Tax=Agilicoccus flavus TaxID=2775968 RepID=UPI001CF6F44B|nr:MerR family transcriptional regulator [Agilicoccus flavus]